MKYMQLSIKTIPFYPTSHYKSIQPQGEQNKQYWNKLAIEFLKRKHNANTTRREFPIKIYTGGPSHKPYFIALTLQGQIIIGPMKKTVALHVVGDLVLLDQFMFL